MDERTDDLARSEDVEREVGQPFRAVTTSSIARRCHTT